MTIQKIISIIIIFCIAFLINQWSISSYSSHIDIVNFCNNHYKNESFLNTMIGDDPAEPKICDSSQWRTGKMQYCDSECFINYDRCLKENATEEQIKFSNSCHWMGADYFLVVIKVAGGFFIPAMFLFILGICLCKEPWFNEGQNDKK